MKRSTLLGGLVGAFLLLCGVVPVEAQRSSRAWMRERSPEFFRSEAGRLVGDQILLYQRETGGWPKNVDMATPMTERQRAEVLREKTRRDDSTVDNGATTTQMYFLASLYQECGDVRYRDGFRAALDYLLSGQYEHGGWPQFWPITVGYQTAITYNDDAIVHILELFDRIHRGEAPYGGDLIDPAVRKQVGKSFDKGIDCILRTQIVTDGELTVWCQQHDHETFLPTSARSYELPSYCSSESAGIVRLLMSLPKPDKRVKRAVHAAMRWFDTYKLTGLRIEYSGWRPNEPRNVRLVEDPAAKVPIWGRFYDLEHCEPYVCDRDGIPRRRLDQIGTERRTGYSWYNSSAAHLYPLYEQWAAKHDPKNKVAIDLHSKGANENGTIQMERRPTVDRAAFDVIVKEGESIQAAIEQAPANPTEPFKILISKGTYNQKVIIDKPNIVLVGEDRDETKLVLAEMMHTRTIKEYKGKPVGNGVIVLQEGADDCVISGLTVYNNYGSTVEPTTAHQMAIFGRATRTIVINCNILADGNDALSLWAREDGMYYHADLDIRCPGVDFLCPRGWCYVTRSKFYGDSRAMIWHDGRGDQAKKLVITDSSFDAASPTLLGRYHHDSQFFLAYCTLSERVLDGNIHYAYSDKVLDPCPWGLRTYYYGCTREGGHSGWLKDNLHEAENAPAPYGVTAHWTFEGKWNPEKRIRDLWHVLAY
ncbi:MAG: pectate lyase [Alistipes sp.]|nr:pectate lyase [Alistipes sp.]